MPLFTLILKAHLTTKYEIIYQILKWKNQITALFGVHSHVKKKMLSILAGTNLSLGSSEWVMVITRIGGEEVNIHVLTDLQDKVKSPA
jgi:hypothetical protein